MRRSIELAHEGNRIVVRTATGVSIVELRGGRAPIAIAERGIFETAHSRSGSPSATGGAGSTAS